MYSCQPAVRAGDCILHCMAGKAFRGVCLGLCLTWNGGGSRYIVSCCILTWPWLVGRPALYNQTGTPLL
jgi:hypothetical protein